MIKKLLEFVESEFYCDHGSPRAYMEFPQRDGRGPLRVIYTTYVIGGKDFYAVENEMREVFSTLRRKALEGSEGLDPSPLLYWRLTDRIEHTHNEEGHRLYTRVAVLHYESLSCVEDDERKRTEENPMRIIK